MRDKSIRFWNEATEQIEKRWAGQTMDSLARLAVVYPSLNDTSRATHAG